MAVIQKILENRILIHLFPKQKVVDVGKLISFRNLLVREVKWFVLQTTSAPFDFFFFFFPPVQNNLAIYTLDSDNSLSYILTLS